MPPSASSPPRKVYARMSCATASAAQKACARQAQHTTRQHPLSRFTSAVKPPTPMLKQCTQRCTCKANKQRQSLEHVREVMR
ncbi:MAG: hypothetical protein DRN96_08215 [Thermoproteota archaeon]|nr:MAG: hypothetical protein DRN96_08215 [Candidatus Korarchaeota archaeon]